jgi:hypothetical protein
MARQIESGLGAWAWIPLPLGSLVYFVLGEKCVLSVYPHNPASRELLYLDFDSSNYVSVVFTDAKLVKGVLQILLQRHRGQKQWAVIVDKNGDPLSILTMNVLQVWSGAFQIFKQGEGNGAKILSDVQEAMLGGQTLVEAVTDMFPPTTQ